MEDCSSKRQNGCKTSKEIKMKRNKFKRGVPTKNDVKIIRTLCITSVFLATVASITVVSILNSDN